MNLPTILSGLAIAVAAAAGGYYLRPPQAANEPRAEAKAEPKIPNQLQFAEGAPQLTAIKTDLAAEAVGAARAAAFVPAVLVVAPALTRDRSRAQPAVDF
jgi:hypothetical protein